MKTHLILTRLIIILSSLAMYSNVYAGKEDVLEYHTNGNPHITVYYEINKDGELEHRK